MEVYFEVSEEKNVGGGSHFFMGSGLSVASKPEFGNTQSSSRITFYTVLTNSSSSSSLPFMTISLVALV